MNPRRNSSIPAGYTLVDVYDEQDSALVGSFLVPVDIGEEWQAAVVARKEAKRRESDRAQETWADSVMTRRQPRIEPEANTLSTANLVPVEGAQHAIFKPAAFDAWVAELSIRHADKGDRERQKAIAKKIASRGHIRDIRLPPDVPVAMQYLRATHPHFGEIIDFVEQNLIFSVSSPQPARIPPILVYGIPGIGKTHFAQQLARILETPFAKVGMDCAQAASELVGIDKHWGNSAYGLLFKTIVLGPAANPVIVLDEVDKAGRGYSNKNSDPLLPLHSLLEPETSETVKDLSLDFEFDTSLVTWILTANDHFQIPETIRSRVRVFHVRPPTAEHSIQVAESVVDSVLHQPLPEDLEDHRSVVIALAHLTAREIRQAMEEAIAHAVSQGRRAVQIADLPRWALWNETEGSHGLLH